MGNIPFHRLHDITSLEVALVQRIEHSIVERTIVGFGQEAVGFMTGFCEVRTISVRKHSRGLKYRVLCTCYSPLSPLIGNAFQLLDAQTAVSDPSTRPRLTLPARYLDLDLRQIGHHLAGMRIPLTRKLRRPLERICGLSRRWSARARMVLRV